MTNKKKTIIGCWVLVSFFLLTGLSILNSAETGQALLEKFKSYESETPLIPEDTLRSDDFKKGVEKPVGLVQMVQGDAYVIHAGQKTAYRLQNDHPLCAGDTLITLARSRLNAAMYDQSVLALAPQAKLTISRSEYSGSGETRSSVMELIWGSARFIVKKLSGDSVYTVKTKTAVCGVRATDFAVAVSPVEEGKTTSALHRFLGWLNPVKEAHALPAPVIITTVVTGPGSTVGLTGLVGGTTTVGPLSVAGAVEGGAATEATFVGPTTAGGVLESVGPELASLSMPPDFK